MFTSKFESYTNEQRESDLDNLVDIEKYDKSSEYHIGLYNGMLLAQHIAYKPYGQDVPFMKTADEVTTGAIAGAGIGAAANIGHDLYLDKREKSISNSRSLKKFTKGLKAGDIIIAGSTPRNSGAVTPADLPKPIANLFKNKKQKLLTNSSLLSFAGAGSKYHGAIYAGGGKVIHMTTDAGAAKESMKDALSGQNMAAYRQKSKAQAASAVDFAKSTVKRKVPYESALEYVKEPLTNMLPGINRSAGRNTKKGLVCHTLPLMAYNKQKFKQGRRTYSGDIRRNLNFSPVARRDVIKHTKVKGLMGQALKGAVYAIPGALFGKMLKKED